MDKQGHEKRIADYARELGFQDFGIVPAGHLSEEKERLDWWLGQGMHGTMTWMERNREKRLDPRLLMEGAKTVIVVLLNYYTRQAQTDPSAPIVSKYAFGRDYHSVMKTKLKELLRFIQQEVTPCSGRAFVDSAPVLEKAWARRAGLGWIGKNSLLISPEHGSFCFIGILLIDAEISPDGSSALTGDIPDRCGTCTRCIDACPTKAIVAPRVIDARRCISYLTIEHKGETDPDFRGKMANRIFGCDICQDVCPWNRKAQEHDEPQFRPSASLLRLTREEWLALDEQRFKEIFRDSPVIRTGFAEIKRNLE